MSTRDLCGIALLPELAEAGVAALKIEGRMKRPEYVAVVTRVYRRALDRLARDPEAYWVPEEDLLELAQIFNREFTTGYLRGGPGYELMNFQRPNNRGVYLGRVTAVSRQGMAIRLEGSLRLGDGLEIWVSRGGRQGLTVRAMWRPDGREIQEAVQGQTVRLEVLPGVTAGDRVFKTHDRLLVERARASWSSPQAGQMVPLNLTVCGEPDTPLSVIGQDDAGHRAEVATTVKCSEARKHPLTPEVLRAQLGRLGGTPFRLGQLESRLKGEIMVPLSSLNEVRRRLVKELEELRLKSARPYGTISPGVFRKRLEGRLPFNLPGEADREPEPVRITAAVGSPTAAQAAFTAGADRVYLMVEQWQDWPSATRRDWEEVQKDAAACGGELYPILPRFWHPQETSYLRASLDLVAALQPPGILVGGPGGWELARRQFAGKKLIADYSFNIYNAMAAVFLMELGLDGLTLSPELNRQQLRELAPLAVMRAELIVHGNFPLLVSAHCPIGSSYSRGGNSHCPRPCSRAEFLLEDRLGYGFTLACDRQCRFYLFNSRELCLLAELPRVLAFRPYGLRLELRRARPEEVAQVVRAYRQGLDSCLAGKAGSSLLADFEASLMKRLGRGFTRGHYYRGV